MAKEFITSENEHWYPSPKKPDVWYPSVTTIIGATFPKGIGFQKYLAGQESWEASQDILKAAGRRGTNVHDATEVLERGGTIHRVNFTMEEWRMLIGFVAWHRKFKPVPEVIEESRTSDKLKTGGRIDRIYIIDGLRTLLDIKTSSAIHDNYWAQTAVYERLDAEKNPEKPVDQTAILRLAPKRKDGYEYVTHDRAQMKEDFKVFKAAHEMWNYLYPKAKPAIIEVPEQLVLAE